MKKERKLILSPTKVAAYLECAVKYRYIYVDKIGRFYMKGNPALSFGSALHSVLRSFHDGAVEGSQQAVEKFEQSWALVTNATEEERAALLVSGTQILAEYVEARSKVDADAPSTLWTEKTVRADLGDFILTGRLDRVDRHADGTLEIVDYKSGRLDTSEEEVAGDLAMNCYRLILLKNEPGARVINTIHCLRSGISASAEPDPEATAAFERDIVALGQEIIAREFEYVEPSRIDACEWCSFLSRCTRYWRWQERTEQLD